MKLIKSINKNEHQLFSEHHSKYGYKKSIEIICSVLDDYDKFNIVYERYGKAKFYTSQYWEFNRTVNLKFVESMDYIKIYVDDDLIDAPKELTEEDLGYEDTINGFDCDGFAYESNYTIVDSLIHDLLY